MSTNKNTSVMPPAGKKFSVFILVVIVLLIVAAVVYFFYFRERIPRHIAEGKPFQPTYSQIIKDGSYTVPSVNVPEGVTLTLEGNLTLTVENEVSIAGDIHGDCATLSILAGSMINLSGNINNSCTTPDSSADIYIHSQNSTVSIGSADPQGGIFSSGDLTVYSGPILEEWEYDFPPSMRSDSSLSPVCYAISRSIREGITTNSGALFEFEGFGLDPDGGELQYDWNFSDGTTLNGQVIEKTFSQDGTQSAMLTVSDDEGEKCQTSLNVLVESLIPEEQPPRDQPPACWVEPSTIMAQAGDKLSFFTETDDFQFENLTYLWQFPGSIQTASEQPAIIFSDPGTYRVDLQVTNEAGLVCSSSASFYIYPSLDTEIQTKSAKPPQVKYSCTPALGTANDIRGPGWLKVDGTQKFRSSLSVPTVVWANARLFAQDGKPGDAIGTEGVLEAKGSNGQNGSALIIQPIKSVLVICGGAQFEAANGGVGGDVKLDNTDHPGKDAFAHAGNGGNPGSIILNSARDVIIQQGNLVFIPGNGGAGGKAEAFGGIGQNDCATPTKGGSAYAWGGRGGSTNYQLRIYGNVIFDKISKIIYAARNGKMGLAGKGGSASAQGGAGGNTIQANGMDCTNQACAKAAAGGYAFAQGGLGGDANATADIPVLRGFYFGGDGGNSEAWGGLGGTGGTCCHQRSGSDGGVGGDAYAFQLVKGGRNHAGGRATDGSALGSPGSGGHGGKGLISGGKGGKGGYGIHLPAGSSGADGGICLPPVMRWFINAGNVVQQQGRQIQIQIKIILKQIIGMSSGVKRSSLPSFQDTGDIPYPNWLLVSIDGGSYQEIELIPENFIDDQTLEVWLELEYGGQLSIDLILVDNQGNQSEPYSLSFYMDESAFLTPTNTPIIVPEVPAEAPATSEVSINCWVEGEYGYVEILGPANHVWRVFADNFDPAGREGFRIGDLNLTLYNAFCPAFSTGTCVGYLDSNGKGLFEFSLLETFSNELWLQAIVASNEGDLSWPQPGETVMTNVCHLNY